MDNWKKVYTSTEFFKAEIVKQVLIDHEIDAVLMNKQDSSYKFGKVEIYVADEQEAIAKEIIQNNDL